MKAGVDGFASHLLGAGKGAPIAGADAMRLLLARIERADEVELDVFGSGEHHQAEYLDSAPAIILAARTRRIRLTSAVTVLLAAGLVRMIQEFATVDLISGGRAELMVGRGPLVKAFPLFGFDLRDYDELFSEKLDRLLAVCDHEQVHWQGRPWPADSGLFASVASRPLSSSAADWHAGGSPKVFCILFTLFSFCHVLILPTICVTDRRGGAARGLLLAY